MAKKDKEPRRKQGHKLVWLTLIIIAIPCAIVGYILLTSMEEQNKPVVGNRFSSSDISPSITKDAMNQIKDQISQIEGVESVSVNLPSATLRIHLNMQDEGLNKDQITQAVQQAYDIVNSVLPIETYFTSTEAAKMYDLEIDGYNYIIDDAHPAEGQIYVMVTKNGAGDVTWDVISEAKDNDLVNALKRTDQQAAAEDQQVEGTEDGSGEYYDNYYDQGQ